MCRWWLLLVMLVVTSSWQHRPCDCFGWVFAVELVRLTRGDLLEAVDEVGLLAALRDAGLLALLLEHTDGALFELGHGACHSPRKQR